LYLHLNVVYLAPHGDVPSEGLQGCTPTNQPANQEQEAKKQHIEKQLKADDTWRMKNGWQKEKVELVTPNEDSVSNGSGKLFNTCLDLWFNEQGILHPPAPYTSDYNGLLDCFLCTLMAALLMLDSPFSICSMKCDY